MKIFRYKRRSTASSLYCWFFFCDLAIYFSVTCIPVLIDWMLFGLTLKIFIAAWNHHHHHVHTFRKRFLNRFLEIVYTFHTGVSTNVWVLHHNLGHHGNCLDQSKDEFGWRRKDGTKMGVWEYAFTIAVTGYV